jgi:hypothetical protein
MGFAEQVLISSNDGGLSWSDQNVFDNVLMPCGEAEVFTIPSGAEVLVNTLSPYTIERSTDGGVSWRYIAMPSPIGLEAGLSQGLGFGPGGLTVLPNGSLLLTGGNVYTGGWELLSAGGHAWCRVTAPPASLQTAQQVSPITVVGDSLWWLTATGPKGQYGPTAEPQQVPLSLLHC